MPEDRRQETDLVLPFGVHAFVLDITKGNVNVYVGPMKSPLSAQQEVPVVMNPKGRFDPVSKDDAIKNNITAQKGEYVILRNPEKTMAWPKTGASTTPNAEQLLMGQMVNIPGPVSFAPWPMQFAEVVKGHHLKSNQYLLVRVYDEDAARANWDRGTIKLVGTDQTLEKQPNEVTQAIGIDSSRMTIGQQLIIKGTEVSFFIPPTGIEVLKDQDKYVREALSLERLEYCLLVDEDGNKRYVRGPEVVFPEPTETFKLNDDGDRKSRAYELSEISGIHIKVIQEYEEEISPADLDYASLKAQGRITELPGKEIVTRREGDELFLTGKTQALYFPRVEHAILKYGDKTRYHAVAIPAGEARYVMDRLTSEIRLERGPSMFLPDPRKEVIAKRILSASEARRYYPGNTQVERYNEVLRNENSDESLLDASSRSPVRGALTSSLSPASAGAAYFVSASRATDVIHRGEKFTPPRTLVIDSKFEGAIQISPWTNYAVQVVNKRGDRRVVVGPQTVMLEFDERLETLLLSTGKPKSADHPTETVYLRIGNNTVSDVVSVVTRDLVQMKITLKYLVRFLEGQEENWFNIDNYVQYLVDHFRSMISPFARSKDVKEFYSSGSSLLRDLILGAKPQDGNRPLATFVENGMQVYDVDVIGLEIIDPVVKESMQKLQTDKINFDLQGERVEAELVLSRRREDVKLAATLAQRKSEYELAANQQSTTRDLEADAFETVKTQLGIKTQKVQLSTALDHLAAELDSNVKIFIETKRREIEGINSDIVSIKAEQDRTRMAVDRERETWLLEQRVQELMKEAEADASRFQAISPKLIEALSALAATGSLNLVSKHLGNLAIVKGLSLGGVFEQMFKGTQLEGLLENLSKVGHAEVVGG